MPHGTPDWAEMAPRSTVYGGIALDELAARLGSSVTHDRRGDVVWLEGFEDGVEKWALKGSGLEQKLEWSPHHARSGAFSALLISDSTGEHFASLTKILPLPVLGKMGLEASWAFEDRIESIHFRLSVYDGVHHTLYQINYERVEERSRYVTTGGAGGDVVTDLKLHPSYILSHTFKMVVDLFAGKYVRAIINESEYPLLGIDAWRSDNEEEPRLEVEIKLTSVLGSNYRVYVDDVIVTQNEP